MFVKSVMIYMLAEGAIRNGVKISLERGFEVVARLEPSL